MKKSYKAVEVEVMMDEKRAEMEFTDNAERAVIKQTVELAKKNGRVGDKVLLVVSPYMIHMPNWQRCADIVRAREIGEEYNRNKWELPKIFLMDGKLYCADGQHRILGAFIAGIESIVVEFMDITELEAIELFLSQTKGRKRMTPSDIYPAAVTANRADYVTLRDICHRYNVQVKGDDSLRNPIGTFTPILDGTKMNPEMLERVIHTIVDLGWYGTQANTAFNSRVIRSLKKVYSKYRGNESTVYAILKKTCFGATWFANNLETESQYRVFDVLMEKLSHYGMEVMQTA